MLRPDPRNPLCRTFDSVFPFNTIANPNHLRRLARNILLCDKRIADALAPDLAADPYLFRFPGLDNAPGYMGAVPQKYQVISGFIPGDYWYGYVGSLGRTREDDSKAAILRLKTWNTKAEPQLSGGKPLVLIFHDWVPATYSGITETIAEIRTAGFPLVGFNPSQCTADNGFYK